MLYEVITEYHAEAVYLKFLEDHGDVPPFFNIVVAEVRHSTSIGLLFESRGWAVPPSEWSRENVPAFATPGVNIGLYCSTPMVALTRAVAPKHAQQMLLTGEMIDADTAFRFGLVNEIVPLRNNFV